MNTKELEKLCGKKLWTMIKKTESSIGHCIDDQIEDCFAGYRSAEDIFDSCSEECKLLIKRKKAADNKKNRF